LFSLIAVQLRSGVRTHVTSCGRLGIAMIGKMAHCFDPGLSHIQLLISLFPFQFFKKKKKLKEKNKSEKREKREAI
jgi:hypothetical protein